MSRAFKREYENAPTLWWRAAHVIAGLALIFAAVQWWRAR